MLVLAVAVVAVVLVPVIAVAAVFAPSGLGLDVVQQLYTV